MGALTLVIGNYNYSSWSLRPWAALTHLGLPFEVRRLRLGFPEFSSITALSPSGRVPILLDDSHAIWDSLAILEYANELAEGRAWPSNPIHRAEARSVAAEMHAGFGALRSAWPMNIRARNKRTAITQELAKDIARIDALWSDCRQRFAVRGPWLFGEYSAADAMYLPVAFRFQTYGADALSPVSRGYLEHAVTDPLIQPWIEAATAEPESIDAYEAVGSR